MMKKSLASLATTGNSSISDKPQKKSKRINHHTNDIGSEILEVAPELYAHNRFPLAPDYMRAVSIMRAKKDAIKNKTTTYNLFNECDFDTAIKKERSAMHKSSFYRSLDNLVSEGKFKRVGHCYIPSLDDSIQKAGEALKSIEFAKPNICILSKNSCAIALKSIPDKAIIDNFKMFVGADKFYEITHVNNLLLIYLDVNESNCIISKKVDGLLEETKKFNKDKYNNIVDESEKKETIKKARNRNTYNNQRIEKRNGEIRKAIAEENISLTIDTIMLRLNDLVSEAYKIQNPGTPESKKKKIKLVQNGTKSKKSPK